MKRRFQRISLGCNIAPARIRNVLLDDVNCINVSDAHGNRGMGWYVRFDGEIQNNTSVKTVMFDWSDDAFRSGPVCFISYAKGRRFYPYPAQTFV